MEVLIIHSLPQKYSYTYAIDKGYRNKSWFNANIETYMNSKPLYHLLLFTTFSTNESCKQKFIS